MSKLKIKIDKRCKICSSYTKDGDEIRPIIETMRGEGKTAKDIMAFAITQNLSLTEPNITRHFKKHAPYVQKGTVLSRDTKKAVTMLTHSSEAAKTALQNIIAMGSEMLDNWWKHQQGQDVTGPMMPVNPKMFMQAIAEEGKRAPKTALDQDFETLTQQAIEGEVVNEPN